METTNYMILGFAVIFGVLFLHLASFPMRKRSLLADLEVLEGQPPARKAAKPKPAARQKRK